MTTVPICPGCGAKFSHDNKAQECKICHLPDEVRAEGTRAIARWKRKPVGTKATSGGVLLQNVRLDSLSKRQRKLTRVSAHRRKARAFRNKHGRVGVKRGI